MIHVPGYLALLAVISFSQVTGSSPAASIVIHSPVPRQVIQRQGFVPSFAHANALGGPALGFADVAVLGTVAPHDGLVMEYRLVDLNMNSASATDWTPVITPLEADGTFRAKVRMPAGGWYRLEWRGRRGDETAASGSVEPIGVGEVFLVAGQSYATNTNEERFRIEDARERIAAFDFKTQSWSIAHDPQPTADGSDGGSIWPPFGDALVSLAQVPVGLANVAVGGTSSTQWMPETELHRRLVATGKTLGGFRAVLWQQGESDVIGHATTAEYVQRLRAIRDAAAQVWGFEPVWLLAKSTLHPTVYSDPSGEGRIRQAIDELTEMPGFRPGPDTDILGGENRGPVESRRHFSSLGQRRAALLWTAAVWQEINRPRPKHELVLRSLPELHLLEPIWSSPIVHRESSILLRKAAGEPAIARLGFPATQILEIRTADGKHHFEVGRNVVLSDDGYLLTFDRPEPLEVIDDKDLFPPEGAPDSYRHRVGHPDQNLLYRPGVWFHGHDIEITYRRRDAQWPGPIPEVAEQLLPKTLTKLRAGKTLRLGISGDSISTGLDASAIGGAAPYQLGYPELVAAQLQAVYGSEIVLRNRAVAGWSITHGRDDLETMLSERPDLLIVAYGMNDVGRRDPEWFGGQVRAFIEHVQRTNPTTELLLVSPMLGNSEWIHTPREMFSRYRDQLAALFGPGVAHADVTSIWQTVLSHKHDLDLTGNGLNHPNDFGHRLYAQVILGCLCSSANQLP